MDLRKRRRNRKKKTEEDRKVRDVIQNFQQGLWYLVAYSNGISINATPTKCHDTLVEILGFRLDPTRRVSHVVAVVDGGLTLKCRASMRELVLAWSLSTRMRTV